MTRLPQTRLIFASILASLLAACASTPKPTASAQLEARSGSSVTGTVSFFPAGEGTRIEAEVRGLTPGEHGFHIHEVGDCSARDAASAKGHFNPNNKSHGHYAQGEHHSGDMPNLVADNSGKAHYTADVPNLYLATGPIGIIGRSVVIHADPDDYKSQPAGISGKRVACGVIRRS